MSDTKFTPGPWRFIFEDGDTVLSPTGDAIAKVNLRFGAKNVDADAHLISAAPDLYEAGDDLVVKVFDFLFDPSTGNTHALQEATKKMVKALAKARGEA